MIPELTIRTRLGAVDLLPFLRRDEGQEGVELREWERRPAALALDERGWSAERIAHATGLRVFEVAEVLNGTAPIEDQAELEPVTQGDIRRVRSAERVMRDGRWFHHGAPHGTASGYKHWGCRCAPCSDAKKATRRPAAKAPAGRHYEHGTYYAYAIGRCRCEPCIEAGRAFRKGRIADLRAERVEVDGRLVHEKAPHGTLNGYSHYGCRCEPCFNVQSEANRNRRQKVALVARIRTIKPEFYDSPGIETLAFEWRLLYVAMWNWADDSGRGKAEARELMGFAFPRDEDMTVGEFRRGLGEVRRVFGVVFYRVGGRPFYCIPSWAKHQKIDKRSASRWPGPEEGEEFDPTTNLPLDQGVSESRRDSAETPPSPRGKSGAGTGEQGNRGTGTTSAPPSEDAPETDALEGDIVDDETDRGGSASTDIDTTKPVTAQTILAWLIDCCTSAEIDLPGRLKGHYAKEIKTLLDEGQPPQRITAALRLMAEDNILNRPSLLSNKVMTVQTGPERAPRREKRSATDEAVEGWLALADQLGEVAA